MANRERSTRLRLLLLGALPAFWGCDTVDLGSGGGRPAPPRELDAFYYDRAVHLSWALDAGWDGEPFRVYGRRLGDPDPFLLAEVTSCIAGWCAYRDVNVVPEVTYEYFVSAVGRDGAESPSEFAVEVHVPAPVPPPVPEGLDAVPLDAAIYLRWDANSREADDFAFYRVYLAGEEDEGILLGETDSEGFLDLLVENGLTYGYFLTAVDDRGHESEGGFLAEATPRPDFHGELLYAFDDRPEASGFRFRESETLDPLVPGTSTDRHLRLEEDADGWWLVPGPGVEVHGDAFFTTRLRCGPAADAGCTDVRRAPATGYSDGAIALVPEYTYVLRVPASQGSWHYGAIRVSHVGFAQDGAIAIFDWAFQLQADNPELVPGGGMG